MKFNMENFTIVIIILLMIILFIFSMKEKKKQKENNEPVRAKDGEDMNVVAHKLIVPLKLQAYERLMLYVERIKFPVLVKRVFYPGISRNDFQFSLLQNVQDEFEHNLAQRLYVTEDTWRLVELSKEEVLQNINAVFNDNPDADVAMIARQIASFNNPMAENAVISIKREFNFL